MDQLMIDVSKLPCVVPGDDDVFIGKCGNGQITASEFAYTAGTISNEVLNAFFIVFLEAFEIIFEIFLKKLDISMFYFVI